MSGVWLQGAQGERPAKRQTVEEGVHLPSNLGWLGLYLSWSLFAQAVVEGQKRVTHTEACVLAAVAAAGMTGWKQEMAVWVNVWTTAVAQGCRLCVRPSRTVTGRWWLHLSTWQAASGELCFEKCQHNLKSCTACRHQLMHDAGRQSVVRLPGQVQSLTKSRHDITVY